jgi:hypothetical protein
MDFFLLKDENNYHFIYFGWYQPMYALRRDALYHICKLPI